MCPKTKKRLIKLFSFKLHFNAEALFNYLKNFEENKEIEIS